MTYIQIAKQAIRYVNRSGHFSFDDFQEHALFEIEEIAAVYDDEFGSLETKAKDYLIKALKTYEPA
jgi:hypothetical protein